MTQPTTQRAARTLGESKEWFLGKLAAIGVVEPAMIVARMRKSRGGDPVGYYSYMSQFRSRPRIVVDEEFIRDNYMSPLLAEEEIRKTIAHEYGHIMAEAIRVVNEQEPVEGRFTAPAWQPEFNGDEEAFAEDFARFFVTFDAHHEPFWDRFMPAYASDFRRIFVVEPQAQQQGRH